MQRPCTTRIPDGFLQMYVRIRKKEQGVEERQRPGKKKYF